MTEPASPLSPIADAFREAGLVPGPGGGAPAAREEADRAAAEAERQADIASIKRGFKKEGLKGALKVGRALGWSKPEIEAIFRPPEPPPRPAGEPPPAGEEESGRGEGGRPRGRDPSKRPVKPLPEDCPVIPLGMLGRLCVYLDPLGQLVELAKHGPEDIRVLFGPRVDWLWGFHPKWKKAAEPELPPVLYAWEAGYTAESLIEACGKRGYFDPARRLRGVGAWRDEETGTLILHCGDGVLFVPADGAAPRWERPGYHGEHVYPGDDRLPRPAEEPADRKPAMELLGLLRSWSYARAPEEEAPPALSIHELHGLPPEAVLLLGWIVTAMIGGALDWRTHAVVTGAEGTGKSTLQKLIAALLGGWLVSATDATAAGIYQNVGYSSRAAAVDEAENDPNSAKMKNMVDLVRNASSGGKILRGSNDAKFKQFTSRSVFLLSAIFLPPFSPQDLTRIAKIELEPLPRDAAPVALEPAKLTAIGRALRRRVVDGWPRWIETHGRYRAQLVAIGHDSRGADQWAALMAAADLALFDDPPDADTVIDWVDAIGRDKLPSTLGNANSSQAMVDYLATLPVDAFRGGNRLLVGGLVGAAAGRTDQVDVSQQSASDALRTHGVYVQAPKLPGEPWRVVLPNSHAGLGRLLEGTPYASRPGAATSGWAQAMSRLPGAQRVNSRPYGRGWSVPIEIFLGEDRVPADDGRRN